MENISYFNHKKSQFWPHAQVTRIIKKRLTIIPVVLFYVLAGISIIYITANFVYTLDFIPYLDFLPFSNLITGLAIISISIAIFLLSLHVYYKGALEQPDPKMTPEMVASLMSKGKTFNFADFASVALIISIDEAIRKSKTRDKNLVDANELYKVLSKEVRGEFVIKRLGFDRKSFLEVVDKYYSSKQQQYKTLIKLDELFDAAFRVAVVERHPKIYVSDVIAALSQIEPFLKQFLFDRNIKFEDVLNIVYWQTTNEIVEIEKKFNPDRLRLTGGIGKEWAMGYALNLAKYSKDMTETVARMQSQIHLIGRRQETINMEKILVRASKHNILLVGQPGVGKSTIVLNFAKKVLYGETYPILANRRIFELNIDYLLAGAQSAGEIIERINAVLSDAVRTGNIILYIENIQSLFGAGGGKVGSVDASDVMLPYLENPELFFIATTDLASYHQSIESKSIVAEKFEKIDIEEPTKESSVRILEDILHWLEPTYGIIVTYSALQKIVDMSDRFMYEKSFPEKAIDLLNEVVVYVKTQGNNIMHPEDVEKVISTKTKVPLGEGEKAEKERLLHLEDYLHERVIGQDRAIKAVADAMRRARAGVKSGNKPIGSFLFLGPTGVGKTETAKALADAYFGSEENMIRFDMSEYQDISGLHRFLGAPPGTPEAESGGQLTNAVKDNPFSLILFDEIEKADPNILNIFLQLLDEGWVTDSLGRKVKFNNSIIIATSNAGAEYIREAIKSEIEDEELQEGLLNYLQQKRLFRPEFINRFNAVISYNPLKPEQVEQITELMVAKLAGRFEAEKGIFIEVTPSAIKKLAEIGYDPLLGARPISRAIEQKLENFLAKKLLSEEIRRGSSLVFDVDDIEE